MLNLVVRKVTARLYTQQPEAPATVTAINTAVTDSSSEGQFRDINGVVIDDSGRLDVTLRRRIVVLDVSKERVALIFMVSRSVLHGPRVLDD